MKLINGVGQKSGQILEISKSHFQIPSSIPLQIFKYGQLNTVEQYQFHKLPISTEKQVDIFSMRGYCFSLTSEQLNYWYPTPSEDENNTLSENSDEKEEFDRNYKWLLKKITAEGFEDRIIDDLFGNF
jgi:hypothetical protein